MTTPPSTPCDVISRAFRRAPMIAIRTPKILLLAATAFFFTLVAFNNLTDFDSNYQFVRHVLMMDSTFPGNHGLWRAIRAPWIHLPFFFIILSWGVLHAIFVCGG